MADFSVSVDPSLSEPPVRLDTFSRALSDLSSFWPPQLGENLADTAQRRWPLKRRSGRLRASLEWTGQRLGRGGIFRSRPSRLTIGSSLFYAGFHQTGTRHQAARPLLHVDADDIGALLTAWARERAAAAGLEVTP